MKSFSEKIEESTPFIELQQEIKRLRKEVNCLEYGGHHWVEDRYMPVYEGSTGVYHCSECKKTFYVVDAALPIFRGTTKELEEYLRSKEPKK